MPDEKEPGASSALLAARSSATIENVMRRQNLLGKQVKRLKEKQLRCVHIGKPGQVKTDSADRILFAASQMPMHAVIAACMSPQLRAPCSKASRIGQRRLSCLE